MSVNKVILIGNVGQDPKVTYFDGGACVAQLRLATTERGYTLQNGTQVPDRTEWHNLVFRNRLGEIVDKFPVTGASISRHLSVLKDADLIRDTREGKFIYYELNASVLEEIMLWISDLKGVGGDEEV